MWPPRVGSSPRVTVALLKQYMTATDIWQLLPKAKGAKHKGGLVTFLTFVAKHHELGVSLTVAASRAAVELEEELARAVGEKEKEAKEKGGRGYGAGPAEKARLR